MAEPWPCCLVCGKRAPKVSARTAKQNSEWGFKFNTIAGAPRDYWGISAREFYRHIGKGNGGGIFSARNEDPERFCTVRCMQIYVVVAREVIGHRITPGALQYLAAGTPAPTKKGAKS